MSTQDKAAPTDYRRWNFDADDDGVMACPGNHDKHEPCRMAHICHHETLSILNAMRAQIIALEAARKLAALSELTADAEALGLYEASTQQAEPAQAAVPVQPAEAAGYVSSVESNSPLMCGLSEQDRRRLIPLYTHPAPAQARLQEDKLEEIICAWFDCKNRSADDFQGRMRNALQIAADAWGVDLAEGA
jgi:hypothetical protein